MTTEKPHGSLLKKTLKFSATALTALSLIAAQATPALASGGGGGKKDKYAHAKPEHQMPVHQTAKRGGGHGGGHGGGGDHGGGHDSHGPAGGWIMVAFLGLMGFSAYDSHGGGHGGGGGGHH
jgi:hypothetical protein